MIFLILKVTVFFFLGLFAGCSTTIYNYGDHGKFELSPGRGVASAPAISVLGGFSLGTLIHRTDSEKK